MKIMANDVSLWQQLGSFRLSRSCDSSMKVVNGRVVTIIGGAYSKIGEPNEKTASKHCGDNIHCWPSVRSRLRRETSTSSPSIYRDAMGRLLYRRQSWLRVNGLHHSRRTEPKWQWRVGWFSDRLQ